jgi:hypothetical protein
MKHTPLHLFVLSAALLVVPAQFIAAPVQTLQPERLDRLGFIRTLESDLEQIASGHVSNRDTHLVMFYGWIHGIKREELRKPFCIYVTSLESGMAFVKGRWLPAVAADVEVLTVNREEAKYTSHRLVHAAAFDREFALWRARLYAFAEDADRKLSEWKREVEFKPAAR